MPTDKEIFEAKMDALANAINTKAGTTGAKDLDALKTAVDSITSGTDTSDATAVAGDLLSGKTAYARGSKITGTIQTKTVSDLSATGAVVSVPAGYYASAATKSVDMGSVTIDVSTRQFNPSISVSSSGLVESAVIGSFHPTATLTPGYISTYTSGEQEIGGYSSQQLSTQAAQTITPTTADQTIASGKYLTGAQTIKGDANLVAANIADGVTIFGVQGTHTGGGGISGGYNVTFKVNNADYAIVSVQAGESVTAPAVPHVTGYYFKGWSVGGGIVTTFPYTPVADTTFYAIMETEAIVGFTGLSNQTPGLTLTDDIANVALWTTSVDSQYVNVSNPLDSYWPFSEIEEMTDSQDNVFVKFPKMWMKWIHKEGTDIVDGVKFANHQVDNDYFVSDAYLDRYGTNIVDYFAIGKYEASGDQSRLISKSNKSVLVSQTRPTFRTYATNNPTPGYQLIDIQILTIYNLLCMMYYRTQNIQDVYAGRTNSAAKTTTGSCDGLAGMNGWNTSTYCVKMLGVENPYGNTAQWIDGVVFDTSTIYIKRYPTSYNDSTSGATAMGFSRPTTAGKITALRHGTSTETRSALYCSAVETGSYTTYVGDYCNYASAGVVLDNGGDFSDGTKAGLWFLGGHITASYYSQYIGGRLAYRPTAS